MFPFHIGTINGQPVYKRTSAGLPVKELLAICISQKIPKEKICTAVPSMVDQSAVFVVDLSVVDYKDLSADDCGIYGRHSSPSEAVEVHLDGDGNVKSFVKVTKDAPNSDMESRYTVRRQYSWHSLTSDYRRVITKVESDSKFLRLAVVQYIVTTCETATLFKTTHGNNTSGEVHQRTKPSVLEKIRNLGIYLEAQST